MNKRMIMLIAFVTVVSLMPASAETLEVRGTIAELDATNLTFGYDLEWNYSNFAGFWYDPDGGLATETLTITATDDWGTPTLTFPYDRTLDEGTLRYQTHPVFHEYELHENEADPDRMTATAMENTYLGGRIGLCVESDNAGGDCGYFIEGWMAEEYVAIDGNADKLCKRLVEFEDNDNKTLTDGEEWNLSGGFVLVANPIDLEGEKIWFSLKKNGQELDSEVVSIGEGTAQHDHVYTYTADIGNEEDVPVFSCYVDAVFRENNTNATRLMYVFLIDDDVLEIDTSDTYGAMEVQTASASEVVLTNDETTIDLDTGSTEHITGNMYFKIADDENDPPEIRFYPFVEYTEPGTYEVRGTIEELDAANPTLVADRVWDYSSFAGFWYDMDDNLQTESLTILAKERDAPFEDTLSYPGDREIGEGSLIYKTHPVFHEYEMHQDIPDTSRMDQNPMEKKYGKNGTDVLDKQIGLCVESDNPGGDCGYFIEGWMGAKYVAIDDNADKLCKLLLEFEDNDKKTLTIGEKWDLEGGFALEIMSIDDNGDKVMLQLFKNNVSLDMEVASTGVIDQPQERVYTYTTDIGGEESIPVFSCYVDAVFKGDISYAQLMYVFLIDDDVLEIKTSQTYGSMEVMTASANKIVLTNDESTIDLDTGTTENIAENMYFKIADDDTAIRFYPFVERTIGGEEPTPP
ncbi:MAG: S-layer protein domain-containing protein, partial [Euryarchaeota archaeon]|nr:S-layer protein domain-containing protein [Euryarchaeota archaeon]